jgi:antitoxin HigA-1
VNTISAKLGVGLCLPKGANDIHIKNPPHPGDFIWTEILEGARLSLTAAAAALRVSRPALFSLLNGKARLSRAMALRIEKVFGLRTDTLMRMQASYDAAHTGRRVKKSRSRESIS